MAIRLIAAPAVEPISLVEAKAHLRVDHTDDDALIAIYIQAARAYVDGKDGFLGRALVTQTWELVLDEFPTDEVRIPLPPLQSIESIKYDDGAGDEQIFDPASYFVDNVSDPYGWVVPVTSGWPSTFDAINAVRIRFVAGYSPTTDSPPNLTSNIPASIKAAMLLHIGSLYSYRENVVVGLITSKLPFASEQLLRPYRVQTGIA